MLPQIQIQHHLSLIVFGVRLHTHHLHSLRTQQLLLHR